MKNHGKLLQSLLKIKSFPRLFFNEQKTGKVTNQMPHKSCYNQDDRHIIFQLLSSISMEV